MKTPVDRILAVVTTYAQLENRQQPPPDVPGLPLMPRCLCQF